MHARGCGFGAVALAGMLQAAEANPLAPKPPPLPAKAKSVIYLFMHGGVSHVDTFDPKPELTRRSGQPLSVELAKTIKTSFIHDPTKAILRGSPWEFQPGGKCGTPVSDLYPNVRERMDDITVLRGCYGDAVRPRARDLSAQHAARSSRDGPVWARGSPTGSARENQNLPAFVVMSDGSTKSGPPAYSAGFLPAVYQGTVFRSGESPILYLKNPDGVTNDAQRETLDFINKMDRMHAAHAARRFHARCAHRFLRAGVPDAELRAGSGRYHEGNRSHEEALRHRRTADRRFRPQVPARPPAGRARRALHPDLSPAPTWATTGTTRTPT